MSALPPWGPYGKRLIGISHVASATLGLRFDLSVFPGLYRRAVKIPAVRYESNYHPWDAAPDLSWFSHRHVIDGRNRLYTDISFATLDPQTVSIRADTSNRTNEPFLGVLHFMGSLQPPPVSPNFDIPLTPARAVLPAGAVFIQAQDYDHIHTVGSDPRRHLPWGGGPYLTGSRNGAVDGFGLFLREAAGAASLSYRFILPEALPDACIAIRHDSPAPEPIEVHLSSGQSALLTLPATSGFALTRIPFDQPFRLSEGSQVLQVRFPRCSGSYIDGFLAAPVAALQEATFPVPGWDPVPAIERVGPRGLLLTYRDAPASYGIAWDSPDFELRQIRQRDLDPFLRDRVHDHVNETLGNAADAHHSNVFIRPIRWPARSSTRVRGLVACGTPDELRARLHAFAADPEPFDAAHGNRARRRVTLPALPSGKPFRFSQIRMAANTLLGAVFPVRRRKEWIIHPSPGRWWDSLYTWDAGFTALGLAHLNPEVAFDHIRNYLVTGDNADGAAFIHYGSPVPTQFHAFREIFQRAPDRARLVDIFAGLCSYHDFFLGRTPNSTTRRLGSGLVTTWDYFYNSGGWDDYPPQQWIHKNKLSASVAPIVNTAHAIRTAKLLATFSRYLGEDDSSFRKDIALLEAAILQHAWDEESGYFGYVTHDTQGNPSGILRTPEGVNFNRGMDGIYPLVAGIGTPEQRRRMIAKLADPQALMTPIGLTTVDQSAPYYRADGYWNGAVWMPHQWFFWKALLDHGEADLAFEIARRALEVWRVEVERSWNCFEHFIVETGRGAGWHQFSGLSCPVLDWFAAYHRPGNVTTGHDALIIRRRAPNRKTLELTLLQAPGFTPGATLIATLPPGTYVTRINGQLTSHRTRHPGCLELTLPDSESTEIQIHPA
jgi:hypothetical protein